MIWRYVTRHVYLLVSLLLSMSISLANADTAFVSLDPFRLAVVNERLDQADIALRLYEKLHAQSVEGILDNTL